MDYLARIRILWGDGFMQTMDAGPRMGSNLLVGVLTATFFVNGVSEGGKGLGELYETLPPVAQAVQPGEKTSTFWTIPSPKRKKADSL